MKHLILAAAVVAAILGMNDADAQTAQSTAADGYIAACTNAGKFLTEPPNLCADDPFAPGAHAIGADSLATGAGAIAGEAYSIAFGVKSNADRGAIAMGYSANASATSVAIGAWAETAPGVKNAVAIGSGSYADEDETVSFGGTWNSDGFVDAGAMTRRLVNVSDGIDPNDAATMGQLNQLAFSLGGGAQFWSGTFYAPTYTIQGSRYSNVGDAFAAVDTTLDDLQTQIDTAATGTQGPAGPAGREGDTGPQGPVGPRGPAGQDGKDAVAGGGTDATGGNSNPLVVQYNTATRAEATLQGAHGTRLHNVAAGTAETDAANVAQVKEALQSAKTYTDLHSRDTLTMANSYTDMRVGAIEQRVNYALAAGVANAQAAAALAGSNPANRNRVAFGSGRAGGVMAWNATYQHVNRGGNVAWNVGVGGGTGQVGSASKQVGVGVSFGWRSF